MVVSGSLGPIGDFAQHAGELVVGDVAFHLHRSPAELRYGTEALSFDYEPHRDRPELAELA
jgi:hypothetical protein